MSSRRSNRGEQREPPAQFTFLFFPEGRRAGFCKSIATSAHLCMHHLLKERGNDEIIMVYNVTNSIVPITAKAQG